VLVLDAVEFLSFASAEDEDAFGDFLSFALSSVDCFFPSSVDCFFSPSVG